MSGYSVIPKRGVLFLIGVAMESERHPFIKPAITIEEQISILKSRGMIFPENLPEKTVRDILLFNNYYRLEGYWFRHYDPSCYPTHRFITGTSFGEIQREYFGDTVIRSLTFATIGYIEIAFRSVFAYTLAKNQGPFPYSFHNFGCSLDKYVEAIKRLEKDDCHSKDDFIRLFHKRYKNPIPPIWMMVEIMSIGEVSRWFADYVKLSDKKEIASHFGVSEKVLETWIRTLSKVRNRCAHHNRIYGIERFGNFVYPKKIALPKYQRLFNLDKPDGFYNIMVIICYLAEMIHRKTESYAYVKNIGQVMQDLNLKEEQMGFPPGMSIWDLLDEIQESD